jgi:excisionase family DNA binding protein
MADETAVYRIFDADDVLLYVGMSVSPETRFADHRTCKAWMRQAYRYEIAWFATRADAEEEEQRAIAQERPLHNTVHMPRPMRPVALSAPGTYTMTEMAKRFGVSKATIRTAVRAGDFPTPVGAAASGRRPTRFPTDAVDAYWARRQAGIKQGKRTDLANQDEGAAMPQTTEPSVSETVSRPEYLTEEQWAALLFGVASGVADGIRNAGLDRSWLEPLSLAAVKAVRDRLEELAAQEEPSDG